MRSGSGNGSGFNRTASTILNIAELAPMPRASNPMVTAANPGSRASEAHPVAKISQQVLHPPDAAAIAMIFLHLFDSSETAAGLPASFFRR